MSKRQVFGRIFAIIGAWAVVSCGKGREMAEQSYQLNLSSSEVIKFKSDLRDFAKKSGYDFVDGSAETKEAREYINKESEKLSGKNSGLVNPDIEMIDITVEPQDSGSYFLIFAKTSAYDANKISLTVAYNENSLEEREMANTFVQSPFLRKWH